MKLGSVYGLVIPPEGETVKVAPENGHDFKFEEMYELLDCEIIQHIALPDGRSMWADELGKMKELPINSKATKLYDKQYDVVVGTVLVTEPGAVL
jgi:hypothetical protein